MSASIPVWLVVSAGLIGLGVYGVLVAGHLLRKLLALNLLGSAVFLLLIVLGSRTGAAPDPVTQAMVLTGIVVAVSATAFGLALLVALYRRSGEASLDDEGPSGDRNAVTGPGFDIGNASNSHTSANPNSGTSADTNIGGHRDTAARTGAPAAAAPVRR